MKKALTLTAINELYQTGAISEFERDDLLAKLAKRAEKAGLEF